MKFFKNFCVNLNKKEEMVVKDLVRHYCTALATKHLADRFNISMKEAILMTDDEISFDLDSSGVVMKAYRTEDNKENEGWDERYESESDYSDTFLEVVDEYNRALLEYAREKGVEV